MKKINILGVDYEVIKTTDKEEQFLVDSNGVCDVYDKKIYLEKEIGIERNTTKGIDEFQKKVYRHEIIHAFFHESGIRKYTEDEELVDWIALQYPKLEKIFNELNIQN